MSVAEAFGKVLKKSRLRRGLSQLELAEVTGLDRTFISLLERGERQPTLVTMLAIAKGLETRAALLVAEVERSMKPDHRRGQVIGSRRL